MNILDFSTTNSQIADELLEVSDSNPVNLLHDVFYNKTGKLVEIYTASGGGGTQLTEGTDYDIGGTFPDGSLPSSISPDVAYTTVAITNATYHDTTLYVSYYPITDLMNADRWNPVARATKTLGEIFFHPKHKSPSSTFPAVCLSSIDGYTDLSSTNYPLLVEELRTWKLAYLEGTASEESTFAGSASGSVITLTDTTANNAMIAALYDDALVNGGGGETPDYTNWRTVDWDGVTYDITDIDTTTREITVTGTPAAGSGNAEFYEHRVAGSTTTARLFEVKGRSLVSANDSDGELISGLRRRDRMQQITGRADIGRTYSGDNENLEGALSTTTSGTSGGSASGINDKASIRFDSANSPNARTNDKTEPRALAVHVFMWAGRYVA